MRLFLLLIASSALTPHSSAAPIRKHTAVSMGAQKNTLYHHDIEVHYRESGRLMKGKPTILLFHGARFSSETWERIGTLKFLEDSGAHAIAMDLPGFAQTGGPKIQEPEARAQFVRRLVDTLELDKVLLVAASMGGTYAYPYLENYGENIIGYVPIAAGGLEKVTRNKKYDLPVLIIWGSADSPDSVKAHKYLKVFSKGEKVVFENAGHACYMDNPEKFNQLLLTFSENATKNMLASHTEM